MITAQVKVTTSIHGHSSTNVHSMKEAIEDLPFLSSFVKPLVECAHNGQHFKVTYELGAVKMVIELC